MNSIAPITSAPDTHIPRLQQRLEEGLRQLRGLLSTLGTQSKPEQIHDIRIATRRLAVLCRFLSVGPQVSASFQDLELPLKELTKTLSAVRSWDVSTQRLKGLERHWRGEGRPGIGFLRKILKQQDRRVRRKCMDDFPKDQYCQDLDPHELAPAWDSLSVSGLDQDLHDKVRKFTKRVLKKWENYQKSQDINDLHRLRIGLKKLRYFLEIEDSCFEHLEEKRIKQLKSVQARLGYIHDLHVLQGHLEKKAIRKKVPKGKKARYHQVQKYLDKSLALALKDFHRGGGTRLPLLLQGDHL